MNTLFWHKSVDIYLDLSQWWFVIKKIPKTLTQICSNLLTGTTNDVTLYALEFGGFDNVWWNVKKIILAL